jgi:ankyrin repeat protein
MDTLPLPPRPNLEQYRKRAKDLVKASPDADTLHAWAEDWVRALARSRGDDALLEPSALARVSAGVEEAANELVGAGQRDGSGFGLADAQRFIAHAHGYESWKEFSQEVEWIGSGPGSVAHARFSEVGDAPAFDAAVAAIVTGDEPALRRLLAQHPDLVRARSRRAHRATLLHYIAANGVERQRTPPNAVTIARLLLEAGSEVDATANTYSGGNAQTTLNLLVSSTPPADADLQEALAEVLLDFGAASDGRDDDGSPLMTALAFGYGAAAETLARRGARIDNVAAAAALGRLDTLRQLLDQGDSIAPTLAALYWIPVPVDRTERLGLALTWAAAFGETETVRTLLERGVDPAGRDRSRMTALHWAAANRYLDVVSLLLSYDAPLEVQNVWGGTVLDSTGWFVVNGCWFPATHPRGDREEARRSSWAEIFEALTAAGADVSVMTYRTGHREVDELLRRHGAPEE